MYLTRKIRVVRGAPATRPRWRFASRLLVLSLLLTAAPGWATSCYTNYRGIVTTELFIPGYGYAVGSGGECAYADTISHSPYEYPSGSGQIVVPSNSVALNSTPGSLPQTPPSISVSGDAASSPAFALAFAAKSYQVQITSSSGAPTT